MYFNKTNKAGYEKTMNTNNMYLIAGLTRPGQWIRPVAETSSALDTVPKFQLKRVSGDRKKRFAILTRSGLEFSISETSPGDIRLKVGNRSAVKMPSFPVVQHSTKYANDLSIKVWMDIAKMYKMVGEAVLANDLDKARAYKKALDISQKLYAMLNKGMMESDFQGA